MNIFFIYILKNSLICTKYDKNYDITVKQMILDEKKYERDEIAE